MTPNFIKHVQELEMHSLLPGVWHGMGTLWKNFWLFLMKSYMQLPSYPVFSLLDIFPREMKKAPQRLMQDCSQQSYSNRPEWQTTQMHHECTTTCVFMELNTIKGGAQLLGGISKVLCREWKVRRKIMVQLHLFADKEQAMQTSKVIPSVCWEAGSWGCFVRGPWEFLARWKSSVSCFLWELPRIYKLQNSFTWTFWCI